MLGRIYYIPLKSAEVKMLKKNLYNLQKLLLSILPNNIAEDLHRNTPGKRTYRRGNVSFFPLGKIYVMRFGFFGTEEEHLSIMKVLTTFRQKVGAFNVNFEKNENEFFTVSPIFIRDSHGKCLYPPRYQEEFCKLLEKHIIRKVNALRCPNSKIEHLKVNVINTFAITKEKYKDLLLPGWRGTLSIQASPDVLSLVYTTGLGGRTLQGFGSLMHLNLSKNLMEVANG